MKTYSPKAKAIRRDWYLIDAKDKILGRLATEIALLLQGKYKSYYVPHLDCGDYVVITNVGKIRLTGRKAEQKVYRRHSGYPGGFREISFKKQMENDPRVILKRAVKGMLPDNKLQDKRLARLKLFADADHSYKDKKFITRN